MNELSGSRKYPMFVHFGVLMFEIDLLTRQLLHLSITATVQTKINLSVG